MITETLKKIFYFLAAPLNIIHVSKASILMYHSVSDNGILFTVTPADFERQMAYIKKRGFRVMSLDGLAGLILAGKTIPAKTLAITFDDGYEDNYSVAWPILKKYGFAATIFLPTAYVGKEMDNSQKKPLPVMSAEQVREMSASGSIRFGSHTHTHPRLENASDDEFRQEILESAKVIEELIGRIPTSFAYPKGYSRTSFSRMLEDCGYRCAVTVREGLVAPGDDLYLLNRNFVYSAGGFSQFKGKLGLPVILFDAIKKILKKIIHQL